LIRSTLRAAIAVATGAAALLAVASPAGAITDPSALDGTLHPQVGMLRADWNPDYKPSNGVVDPFNGTRDPFCAGFFVGNRAADNKALVVTARHCFIDPNGTRMPADVWWGNNTDYLKETSATLRHGTWVAFEKGSEAQDDLALVILDKPLTGVTPMTMPQLGSLSAMRAAGTIATQKWTVIGQGARAMVNGASLRDDTRRRYGVMGYKTLSNVKLRLDQSAAKGFGGSCGGDSGAPITNSPTSLKAYALLTTGDAACVSTSVGTRLDTPTAKRFYTGLGVTYPTGGTWGNGDGADKKIGTEVTRKLRK
jgi:hypothetical protein